MSYLELLRIEAKKLETLNDITELEQELLNDLKSEIESELMKAGQ